MTHPSSNARLARRALLLALGTLLPACAAKPQAVARPMALAIGTTPESIQVSAANVPFATVHLVDRGPLYLKSLVSPRGVEVLRPAEGRAAGDHPEQLPLMIAHGSVGGMDFWNDIRGGAVVVKHRLVFDGTGLGAKLVAELEWRKDRSRRSDSATPLLSETRTVSFQAFDDRRSVDIVSKLIGPADGVRLGDVKDAYLALRLADAFSGPSRTAFTDVASEDDGNLWGSRGRWFACTASMATEDGEELDVTVAVLDHPDNIRHPATWHVRPYGLVAANPFGIAAFEEGSQGAPGAVSLGPYEDLELRYRVLVFDRPIDAAGIDVEWRKFANIEEPVTDAAAENVIE